MGEIYAGSVCTIAALTAKNSHDGGCFGHARNPLSSRPCRILPDWYIEGNPYVGTDLRLGLSPLPLHTRAWVVQERILASRTLYYGWNGLAWECVECSATEGVPAGDVSRFSPKADFFDIVLRPPDDRDTAEKAAAVYDLWTGIQAAYTRCLLTRFDDRLVAITGVIKRIEKAIGWRNLWGLWQERFLRDLLWFVEEPSTRPSTEQYLAPTWSWVGIQGRVMMVTGGEQQCEWAAEVVANSAVLPGGEGHIRLRAMTTAVRCTPDGQLNPGIDVSAPRWQEVDWDPDVALPAARIDVDSEAAVRCVLIARIPECLGPATPSLDIGLVVAQRDTGDWMRLGVFRQLRDEEPLFPECLRDAAHVMEITLV
jgi:hypothetical protein